MKKMRKPILMVLLAGTGIMTIQQAQAWWGGNRWDDDDWWDRPYYRYGGPYGWGNPYYGGWGGYPYGGWGAPYGWGGYPGYYGGYAPAGSGSSSKTPPPPPRPE